MAVPELATGRLRPGQRTRRFLAPHSPGMSCSMLHFTKAGRHLLSKKPLGSSVAILIVICRNPLISMRFCSWLSCTHEHEGLKRLSVPLYIYSTALAQKLCPALKNTLPACMQRQRSVKRYAARHLECAVLTVYCLMGGRNAGTGVSRVSPGRAPGSLCWEMQPCDTWIT